MDNDTSSKAYMKAIFSAAWRPVPQILSGIIPRRTTINTLVNNNPKAAKITALILKTFAPRCTRANIYSAMSTAINGYFSTSAPNRKNVAFTPRFCNPSSNFIVYSGFGPSSNVIAILCFSSIFVLHFITSVCSISARLLSVLSMLTHTHTHKKNQSYQIL